MLKVAYKLIHWSTMTSSKVGTLGGDISKWKTYLETEGFVVLFSQVTLIHLRCLHMKHPDLVHKARRRSLLLEKTRDISFPWPERQPVCSKGQSIFQGTGHYLTHLAMEPGRSWQHEIWIQRRTLRFSWQSGTFLWNKSPNLNYLCLPIKL